MGHIGLILTSLVLLAVSSRAKQVERDYRGGKKMEVTSTAFSEGGTIQAKYTCDGENVSPPLSWNSAPEGTKSLALIMDDPDAPMGTFVHWVMFDVPAKERKLPENVPPRETLPNGAIQGKNGRQQTGYTGPCPPSGTHRYYFKLYALDTMLSLKPGATKQQALDAMKGHVLGQGQLMGRYKRKG